MKKIKDDEITEVLKVIANSAKKLLRSIRKKDTRPIHEARQLVKDLKSE